MNTALWIVAGFLTVVYLLSGFGKLLTPQQKLASMMGASRWVLDFRPGTLKAIGGLEVLGAIGVTLPGVIDIAPVLVPLAATGLALVMTGAVILRLHRHELRYAPLDLAYLLLAAFVAFGRFGPESFTS